MYMEMCNRDSGVSLRVDSFFFQAEDGIRGRDVTGVQTCALPISPVADAEQQVGVHQADQVVGSAGAEDLPVAGVVADEGDLAGDDREPGGSDQLVPGVTEQDDDGPAGGEQDGVQPDLQD